MYRSSLVGKRLEFDGKLYTIYAVSTTGCWAHAGDVMRVNDAGEVEGPKWFFYEDVDALLVKPGRPAVGQTRKLSLTLPDDVWSLVDDRVASGESMSAVLREYICASVNGKV